MTFINASRLCTVKLVRELWKRQQLTPIYKFYNIKTPETLNDATIKAHLVPDSYGMMYVHELHGKFIKTNFSNMSLLDPVKYDKYAGEGAFARIVKELTEKSS